MNKKFTSTALAAFMIAGSTSFSAFAAMPEGTVVIGTHAFDLAYANDVANAEEISAAVVEGGEVYVKDFNGNWLDNVSGLAIEASDIPAVVYTDATGTTNYNAEDTDVDATVAVTSVSAINTKTLEVKLNKEVVDLVGLTFTAKRGTTAVVLTSALSADKKSVTLTSATNLVAGEYTVTVTGGTFVTGTNAGTVTVASQKIGKIEFTGDVLAKTGIGTATVGFKAFDQYGTDITGSSSALLNNINWSANVAVDSLNDVNGVLTINLAGSTDFVALQTVLISAVDSITGISKTTTFTVGTMAAVKTLALGDVVLPTDTTRIYTGEDSAATIAVIAKDQYGNDLDKAAKLTGVTVLSSDSAVIPTIVDVDSKPVISLDTNALTIAKSVTLTVVINATGETVSKTVEIAKPAQADVVTLGVLETNVVAENDAANKFILPITVVNQFGETLTAKQVVAAGLTITGTGSFAGTGLLAIEGNSNSVNYGKIVNTNVIGAAGVGTIVVTSPSGKTASANYDVKAVREVNEVIAPKTIKANLVSGATTPVAIRFIDQYGDVVAGSDNTVLHYNVDVTDLTGDAGVITSSLTTSSDEAELADLTVTAVAGKVGTAKVSVQLLNASNEVVSQYDKTFTVVANNADGLVYSIGDVPTLYSDETNGDVKVDGTNAYAAAISFSAKDATGNEFAIPNSQILNVESIKGFFNIGNVSAAAAVTIDAQEDSYVVGAIDPNNGSDAAAALDAAFGDGNTATDTIKVTFNTASGVKVVTKDITISKAAAKATEMKIVDTAIDAVNDPYALATGTKDVTAVPTFVTLAAATTGTTANVFVVTKDQYGVYKNVQEDFILNSVNLLTFGAGDKFETSAAGNFKLTDAGTLGDTQFTGNSAITFSVVEGALTDTLTVKITAETPPTLTSVLAGSSKVLTIASANSASVIFTEDINATSRTAVVAALKAKQGGTGTATYTWSDNKTLVIAATVNAVTFDTTGGIKSDIVDLFGNKTVAATLVTE